MPLADNTVFMAHFVYPNASHFTKPGNVRRNGSKRVIRKTKEDAKQWIVKSLLTEKM